jgi:fructosamine-3-kinase
MSRDRTAGRVASAVGEVLDAEAVAISPLSGGDVARAFRVELSSGSVVFAKTHDRPPVGFFTTEAAGLAWLAAARALRVPEVLAATDGGGPGDNGPLALLVLAWIDESHHVGADESTFGRQLAALHRARAPRFGREDRRRTGSLQLPNEPCETWAEFYASCRLVPLIQIARDRDVVAPSALRAIEQMAGDLERFGGADEPPARLHGDLWAGNRLVDRSGHSWLIDPAAHGGHREYDLAMMRLFGGFSEEAFDAYGETTPLSEGWQHRIALHQLAPLLVHAIKFAGPYPAAVHAAVESLDRR